MSVWGHKQTFLGYLWEDLEGDRAIAQKAETAILGGTTA